VGWDPQQPELMFRGIDPLRESNSWPGGTWVCGCGGGSLIAPELPDVLRKAEQLVLDADALNAVAADMALQVALERRHETGGLTVLTPHPLEAARLLGVSTHDVQSDRVAAATQIAKRYKVICVLKGSGTVVSCFNSALIINSTGNARLATAGTGDVLAGMLGAALAQSANRQSPPSHHFAMDEDQAQACLDAAVSAVVRAVHIHGELADHWPESRQLTAGRLANALWTNRV